MVPVAVFTQDGLRVEVYSDRRSVGGRGAQLVAQCLSHAVESRGSARVVVATGNSQLALMDALRSHDIPWQHITVFHLDEYIGIGADHPASFRRWIHQRVEAPFHPARVEYIDGDAADPAAECARYEKLLRAAPIDLVLLGIGENGHLAFNEPGSASFDGSRWVNQIDLEPTSLQQQVNEGHFSDVSSVPRSAISLSIPAILSAQTLLVSTPERRKSSAVHRALTGEISTACPASILRTASTATLLLDTDAASLLDYGSALVV